MTFEDHILLQFSNLDMLSYSADLVCYGVSFEYDAAQNPLYFETMCRSRSKKSVVNTNTNINKDVYYIRDASGNTMGVYEKTLNTQVEEASSSEMAGGGSPLELEAEQGSTFVWKEQYLYGSSRLGGIKPSISWTDTLPDTSHFVITESISLGWKYYEAGNHLGNVLTVANDRKIKVDTDGDNEANYFDATILSATDYYPFGMDMTSRTFVNTDSYRYRYGFNGKEKDTEWGDANHYDYGFRIYNPEIAKFLSVDPLTGGFPFLTSYSFAENEPIASIDLDGLENYDYRFVVDDETGQCIIGLSFDKKVSHWKAGGWLNRTPHRLAFPDGTLTEYSFASIDEMQEFVEGKTWDEVVDLNNAKLEFIELANEAAFSYFLIMDEVEDGLSPGPDLDGDPIPINGFIKKPKTKSNFKNTPTQPQSPTGKSPLKVYTTQVNIGTKVSKQKMVGKKTPKFGGKINYAIN